MRDEPLPSGVLPIQEGWGIEFRRPEGFWSLTRDTEDDSEAFYRAHFERMKASGVPVVLFREAVQTTHIVVEAYHPQEDK